MGTKSYDSVPILYFIPSLGIKTAIFVPVFLFRGLVVGSLSLHYSYTDKSQQCQVKDS